MEDCPIDLAQVSAMSLQMDPHHKVVVDRVEAIASAAAGDALHIRGLCKRCGVTERNLRKAFRVIYGVTPYRCLRGKRMQQARDALLDAPARATVTSIAMHFGFLELGRFSVEYRAAFGERPSETLRRSRTARLTS
jgi:AraC family ethanolamine operon transcriptional activator